MKQFNEEYKEYVKADAPDLWERIEAGLDMDIQREEAPLPAKAKKNSGRNVRMIRFVTSMAACIAALVLAIPVYRMVSGPGHSGGGGRDAALPLVDVTIENREEAVPASDEAAAGAVVTEEARDAADVDDAAPIDADDVAQIEYKADLYDDNGVAAVEAEESMPESDVGVQGGEVVASKEGGRQASAEDEPLLNALAEGAVSMEVSAKVTGCYQNAEQETKYEVEILCDYENGLKTAQVLTVTADADAVPLEVGGEYTLTLEQIDLEMMTAVLKYAVLEK